MLRWEREEGQEERRRGEHDEVLLLRLTGRERRMRRTRGSGRRVSDRRRDGREVLREVWRKGPWA